MTQLRPSSLRARVLLLVADDAMVAEDLAAHLCPPPKMDGPPGSAAAWRELAQARAVYRREAIRRVSRALEALHAVGLVAPCGAPRLAEWFLVDFDRRGVADAVARAHPAWPAELPDLAAYRRMVEACGQGPGSTRELLGESPSGAAKRVYRELVEWGVIVSASSRVATEAGRAEALRLREAA